MNVLYAFTGPILLFAVVSWVLVFTWPWMLYPALVLTGLLAMLIGWEIWIVLTRGLTVTIRQER